MVKLPESPLTPATNTDTGPVMEPADTIATTCVSLQLIIAAPVPPGENCTVLVLCVGPKPLPVSVTVATTGAIAGETPLTEGGPSTVHCTPLLVALNSVTVTGPGLEWGGRTAVRLGSGQGTMVDEPPVKVTFQPCPRGAPKP